MVTLLVNKNLRPTQIASKKNAPLKAQRNMLFIDKMVF